MEGDEAAVSNELDRTPKCPSLPNLIDVIGRYGIVEVAIHLDRFRSSNQYIHCWTHKSSSRTAPSYSSVYRWNSCMGKRPADDDNPYCDRFWVRAPPSPHRDIRHPKHTTDRKHGNCDGLLPRLLRHTREM